MMVFCFAGSFFTAVQQKNHFLIGLSKLLWKRHYNLGITSELQAEGLRWCPESVVLPGYSVEPWVVAS